jgi:hypothetical protein
MFSWEEVNGESVTELWRQGCAWVAADGPDLVFRGGGALQDMRTKGQMTRRGVLSYRLELSA